ncbi:OmpA family protein [Orrella sp. JC864]|uniref:OmpA family protein n=1 Tax=Orrella sp. JC864 TaxID=3120298 RepID=UPI0030098E19
MLASRRKVLGYFLAAACVAQLPACQTTKGGLTPAQIAVLKEHGFELTEEGWALGLSNKVLFGVDEVKLGPQSNAAVQRIGAALAEVGITTVRVDGHTDNLGSDAYNDALSLRRAQSVAQALAQAGLPRQGIFARGLGKRRPVASNATREGRAQNRRVSIVIAAH